ncbi:UNVERIFIED_CONTAM: hypothetical protein Cloal_3256 [Acetivibrio alkalicellulosi]
MKYRNFDTAIYFTVNDLLNAKDISKVEEFFDFVTRHINVSKVYLETFRCSQSIDKEKLDLFKDFFCRTGIATSGGITASVKSAHPWEFKSLCYTNPKHLEQLENVVRFTAQMFDEIILDDFYFTNCKCHLCTSSKGSHSWSDFRTELMKTVSENTVLKTAKEVNPKINMIIKYPNWYDHYQGTGYNLKDQPNQFDNLYTGTETRNPSFTQQALQRYTSYFLMRYLENVKPDSNLGGWFDGFDCLYNIGSYIEQAYLTLFGKAKEVTLFCAGTLMSQHKILIPLVGHAFDELDKFLGKLGTPMGLSCYKPFNSSGEDYIHGYLGMLGIPLEPSGQFDTKASTILLTESAKKDEKIVDKIKSSLNEGNTVIITSGLLKELSQRGINDIVELNFTDKKSLVSQFACDMKECSFKNYYRSFTEILMPQIEFNTNDCWQVIVGIYQNKNLPLLLESKYGKGKLYVLTVPDNYGDFYNLPFEVLNKIREVLLSEFYVKIEGPSNIGLFVYDNNTFIVESFLPYNSDLKIIVNKENATLVDFSNGKELSGVNKDGNSIFTINVEPTSYKVFIVKT